LNTELAQCAGVKDSLARLVCFDNFVAASASLSVVEKQPTVAAQQVKVVPVIAPVADKTANFGAEHLKRLPVAEEDLQVVFVIKKLKKNPYGQWRITFNNGQQWKQTDDIHFRIKAGESVILKKGALSAVFMKKTDPDSNKKIRIKRVI
jgi:hypothetical protein